MEKNPPEFYGTGYLKRLMGDTGGLTRWEDNGAFWNAARFAARIARPHGIRRILDVGCGRGFVVRHLRNLGFDADGMEYAHEAVANSVCDARWADLTDWLPCDDGTYGLVLCNGVISHLPEASIPNALRECWRVSGSFLWTNLLVVPRKDQRHHLTVRKREWWLPRFQKAGWEPRNDLHALLEEYGQQRSALQWAEIWAKR